MPKWVYLFMWPFPGIKVYLFNIALCYCMSLVKTRSGCALIFVGLVAIVISAGDFIF